MQQTRKKKKKGKRMRKQKQNRQTKTQTKLLTNKTVKPNVSKSCSSTSVGSNATGSEVQSRHQLLPDTTALFKVCCRSEGLKRSCEVTRTLARGLARSATRAPTCIFASAWHLIHLMYIQTETRRGRAHREAGEFVPIHMYTYSHRSSPGGPRGHSAAA